MTLEEYIERQFGRTPTIDEIQEIKKLSKQQKVSAEYQECVDFWLKEFHIGWDFGAMHGKAMKSIITKIKKRQKEYGIKSTKDSITRTFVYICKNLPEWYEDKDLPTINSKFNEIAESIKRPKSKGAKVDVNNLSRIANQRYGNAT